MPIVDTDPHLSGPLIYHGAVAGENGLTFRNVLNPAKMLPPIHVLYLRSGGAKILMRVSLAASRCISCSSRSPKPLVSVAPPDSTMPPKSAARRSRSVRAIDSANSRCAPGHSRLTSSGSKRISGARKRSGPICPFRQLLPLS